MKKLLKVVKKKVVGKNVKWRENKEGFIYPMGDFKISFIDLLYAPPMKMTLEWEE